MKAGAVIGKVLLGFVLVSVGFSLGREMERRNGVKRSGQGEATASAGTNAGDKVVVYYMYGPIRCVTCNKIETMAKDVVRRKFAQALESGRLEWKAAHFEEEEALARRYDIASSTLVVVRQEGNADVKFQKLDKVWELVEDKAKFDDFVEKAIQANLERGGL